MKIRIFTFFVTFFVSLCSLADINNADDWIAYQHYFNTRGVESLDTYYSNTFFNAQCIVSKYWCVRIPADYVSGSPMSIWSGNMSGYGVTSPSLGLNYNTYGNGSFGSSQTKATIIWSIRSVVSSLLGHGVDISESCRYKYLRDGYYYCTVDSQSYILNSLNSSSSGPILIQALSELGSEVSNIFSVVSLSSDTLLSISSKLSDLSASLSVDWSVKSGLLNSQLFKGRYNSSLLPSSLQNHFESGLVLQPSDDIGRAYLDNWYNALKNGTSDSFVDFWRMAGVSVSEDGEVYTYDSTANNLNFGNRTISLSDYMSASPFQQSSYKSAVQKATNTNSVERLGGDINRALGSASRQLGSISNSLDTLSRPRSAENQEKRELDAQANAQAIKQALANNNNSLFNVHVSNWPDDGIKVDFDDQELNIGFNASAGSAVSSIKDEIKNLVDDFREWSGVEDGGNNLVIQDNIATNMGLIVASLATLTNSYLNTTNTYPYGQYTALQSTNDQDNARSYISSVQSELSRYRDFNAEDYISWGLSSYMNPSDRSDWNALRLMCINARMPDYITLVIPEFGSFGPWTLRVPTAPVVRIVSVSRFCCRMTYLFILLWIAAWCFRRYRDILDILRDAFGLKGPMQVS